MDFVLIIQNFLLFLYSFKYVALFVGMIIEGPMLMITSGFLIHSGFFDLIPTFFAIMLGDLVGDTMWYNIGRYGALPAIYKYGKIFHITPEIFEKTEELFKKYHERILIISKLTIGMSIATLLTAGATKISFKKFISINFLAEIILVSGMLTIGYFFGQIYFSTPHKWKIIFLIFILIMITTYFYLLRKYVKTQILKE